MHEMLFRCQLKYPNLHRLHRKDCKQFTSKGSLVRQTHWQAEFVLGFVVGFCFCFFFNCECYNNVHICIFINIYILPLIKKVRFVQFKMLTCLLRHSDSLYRRWNNHVLGFVPHLSHQLNSSKVFFCTDFFFFCL